MNADRIIHLSGPVDMRDSLCGRPDGQVLTFLAGDPTMFRDIVNCKECLHRATPTEREGRKC